MSSQPGNPGTPVWTRASWAAPPPESSDNNTAVEATPVTESITPVEAPASTTSDKGATTGLTPATPDTVEDEKKISISQEKEFDLEQSSLPSDDKDSFKSDVNGDVVLIDSDGNVRRLPIPTNDPNDPLNFPRWKKFVILGCCCWFSIFSLVLVGGLGPILTTFLMVYESEGKSYQEVGQLSNYPSLAMACGAFVILPAAIIYGRRPTFLACCIFLLASSFGAAVSPDFNTHLACRILQGLATGATESVLPLIVTDIAFLDERGLYYGIYWGSQALVNTAFLIGNSYLVEGLGWRWFYWLLGILTSAGLVIGFFALTETKYVRVPVQVGNQVVHTDEWGVTKIMSEEEARQTFGQIYESADGDVIPEKKSYISELKPWSKPSPQPLKIFVDANIKMLQCFSSPAIIFAILLAAIGLGIGIAMALTYSVVLTELYQWSYASVGLINIGVFPGSIIATIYTGWFGDKLNLWLARRRGGVHYPEDTLVQLVPVFFIGLVGVVIYGVTANQPQKYSWWGIVMGWTFYQTANTVILINTTQFAAEAYPKNPGPALTIVIGVKNIVSFGASYGIIPMVVSFNYLTAYMILLAFYIVIFLLGIPVYLYNPRWRSFIAKKNN
ncbi:MFS transporter-like protein 81 [Elsinoe australis]|uniref:MFS transporter-like protein 81 n=1 Tax=Elsinoe australis TaxID=40998 RepID=A0A4U7B440_9PEZI|nr:MFS transporter-like protein 81 [Elsinoe australis]